jgi:hypothetical protein
MNFDVKALEEDPDILQETQTLTDMSLQKNSSLSEGLDTSSLPVSLPYRFISLHLSGNSFQGGRETAQLLQEIGGVETLKALTTVFYNKAFADPHLDQFILRHNDPHFERLGNWIAEKMDPSQQVGSAERKTRSLNTPHQCAGGTINVTDRSSAHAAAWHCTKRKPEVQGEHFQLHDARVWMRLMFWSAKEIGVFQRSPTFESWYVRFIAHFVHVYEREAPPFAREANRWSCSEENIAAYLQAGNSMGEDVLGEDGRGLGRGLARQQLPQEERDDAEYPYGLSD